MELRQEVLAQVRVRVCWNLVPPRGELRGVSNRWVWKERRRKDLGDTSSFLRRRWWHGFLR